TQENGFICRTPPATPCKSSDLGLFSVALQFEPGNRFKRSLRARDISVRCGQESILNDHRRSSSEVPNEPSIDIAGEFAPSLATQQTRSYAKHFASAGRGRRRAQDQQICSSASRP